MSVEAVPAAGTSSVLVVGNPWPGPRAMTVGLQVVRGITAADPDTVVDLAGVGPQLFDDDSAEVARLVAQVQAAGLLVVVSPTFRGTYTGLLKLFLERFAVGSLRGIPTVAAMLGGSKVHSLAVEAYLKPLLAELGAMCLGPGIFVSDSDTAWVERSREMFADVARLLPAALTRIHE